MMSLKICSALLMLAIGTLLYGPDVITYNYDPTLKIFGQFEPENKQEEQATTVTEHELENTSDEKPLSVQSSLTEQERTKKITEAKRKIAKFTQETRTHQELPSHEIVEHQPKERLATSTQSSEQNLTVQQRRILTTLNLPETATRQEGLAAIEKQIAYHQILKEDLMQDMQNTTLTDNEKIKATELIAHFDERITRWKHAQNILTATDQSKIRTTKTQTYDDSYTLPTASDTISDETEKNYKQHEKTLPKIATFWDRFIEWVANLFK